MQLAGESQSLQESRHRNERCLQRLHELEMAIKREECRNKDLLELLKPPRQAAKADELPLTVQRLKQKYKEKSEGFSAKLNELAIEKSELETKIITMKMIVSQKKQSVEKTEKRETSAKPLPSLDNLKLRKAELSEGIERLEEKLEGLKEEDKRLDSLTEEIKEMQATALSIAAEVEQRKNSLKALKIEVTNLEEAMKEVQVEKHAVERGNSLFSEVMDCRDNFRVKMKELSQLYRETCQNLAKAPKTLQQLKLEHLSLTQDCKRKMESLISGKREDSTEDTSHLDKFIKGYEEHKTDLMNELLLLFEEFKSIEDPTVKNHLRCYMVVVKDILEKINNKADSVYQIGKDLVQMKRELLLSSCTLREKTSELQVLQSSLTLLKEKVVEDNTDSVDGSIDVGHHSRSTETAASVRVEAAGQAAVEPTTANPPLPPTDNQKKKPAFKNVCRMKFYNVNDL